jgi:hypothetical protein
MPDQPGDKGRIRENGPQPRQAFVSEHGFTGVPIALARMGWKTGVPIALARMGSAAVPQAPELQSLRKNAVVFHVNRPTGNSLERARLQPCHRCRNSWAALAAEGCFWSFPTFSASVQAVQTVSVPTQPGFQPPASNHHGPCPKSRCHAERAEFVAAALSP